MPRRSFQGVLVVFCVVAATSAYSQASFRHVETDYSEPPIVKDAAGDVLARPEFRNLPQLDLGPDGRSGDSLKAQDEEKEKAARQVRSRSGSSGPLAEFVASLFGGAISLVVVVVLVAVLGGIVALIVVGLRRWERTERRGATAGDDAATDDEPESLLTPGDKPADAWLAAARQSAAAGCFDEALALLLLGAMGHTERAGLIRPRRGLTYRDYLRAIPESSAWYSTLDRLIRAYAPVGFGRRLATADAFDAVLRPYEAALAAEPTPGIRAPSPA
ncbi:MAG: DUF4129 domain-containing protein [Planctomycetaceae bacterium]